MLARIFVAGLRHPEKLFPVAVEFDDLCEKFFYCPVDRTPVTFWERLRARRW